jgi:tRNA(fMet)-specific endonuclease VapC
MKYMLDTNIVSYLLRGQFASLEQRILNTEYDQVCISVITAGELAYGFARATPSRRMVSMQAKLTALLQAIQTRPLPDGAGGQYGQIRSILEKKGTPIGGNDLWLAAHALEEDLVLVTNNIREFERVKGLKLENWVTS